MDIHGPTSGMRPSIVFWRKPPVFAQKRWTQKCLHIPTTRAANFLQFYEAARLPTFGTWVELWELWLHTNTDKYMYSTLIFNYSIAILLATLLAANPPLSQSTCLPSKWQQSQKIDMSIHKNTFYLLPKTYDLAMLFSSMTTATGAFHSRRILQQVQPSPQPVQFFLRSWVLVHLDLVDHSPHFPGNLDCYVGLERMALQQLVSASCYFASSWRPWAAVKRTFFPYSQQIQYF